MAWIYLAESAESPKACQNGLDRSPIASATDLPGASSSSGNSMGISHARRYGMTFGPLTVKCSHSYPTSFMVDSRAKTFPLLTHLQKVWTESAADYFLKSPDYVAIFDHSSFSWKTSQLSLFGGLTEFAWSSLRWGMICGGRLYQPPKLAPRTCGNGGLCWPTATATATAYGNNQSASPGSQVRDSLQTIAKNWPTLRAQDGTKGGPNSCNSDGSPLLPTAAARWATATARDYKGRDTPSRHGKHSPSIDIQVAESGHPGLLNPRFVEELMGYARESTKLNHLGTPWSRCRSVKRSDGLPDSGEEE